MAIVIVFEITLKPFYNNFISCLILYQVYPRVTNRATVPIATEPITKTRKIATESQNSGNRSRSLNILLRWP